MYVSLLFFYLQCQQTTKTNCWRSSERGQANHAFWGMPKKYFVANRASIVLLLCFDPLSTTMQSNTRVSSTIGS